MNEIAYIKNKEYIYVLTNNDDNINQLDISIFETDEWNNLIKISKVFEEAVLLDKSDYINISQIYKNSVYYLYYSPFCYYGGFSDLQYEKLEINNIYEVVFNLVKESKEKLTINEFRKWIAENQADIQTHYGNLLNFDKND